MRLLRALAALGVVASAACATKRASDPLADLRLYGADGAWAGTLTPRRFELTAPGEPALDVANPGFPCEPQPDPTVCFFGGVGHTRYVNLQLPAGERLSLVATREPCRLATGRTHPYRVSVGFSRAGETRRRLEGCAGPLRTRGR